MLARFLRGDVLYDGRAIAHALATTHDVLIVKLSSPRRRKVKCSCSTIVLTVLLSALLPTASQAATKSSAPQKAQVDSYKAREKCISDAIAAVPGNPNDESGVMALRTDKYRECARRMGFRP